MTPTKMVKQLATHTHAIWVAIVCTDMSNRWTTALPQPIYDTRRLSDESTDTIWGSGC